MIYHVLRPVAEAAVQIFFRRIDTRGLHEVPREGPVIFAANHPNTMMDALLLGLCMGRRVSYLAKSTLWNNPALGWLVGQLGAIPIVRRKDLEAGNAQDMARANHEAFARCREALAGGAAIVIFPEGISHNEPRLAPIKTGTARIALETEAERGWGLGSQIIPVGLNYREPETFDSEVVIDVGRPVAVNDYRAAYERDASAGVRALTAEVESRLQGLVVHVPDPQLAELVRDIDDLYAGKLIREVGEIVAPVDATRTIADAVKHFREREPERVKRVARRLRAYRRVLELLRLPDVVLRDDTERPEGAGKRRALRAVLIVVGAPIAIYGWATNVIPYRVPRAAVRRLSPDLTEVSSLKLMTGLFAFLVFYVLEALLVGWATGTWQLAVAFAASLPLAGMFALRYGEWLQRIHFGARLVWGVVAKKRLLASALAQRSELIAELDSAATEYRRLSMAPVGGKDRVNLSGTELRVGDDGASPVATLRRCEPEGLRVSPAKGEELVLAAGEEVKGGALDLRTGRVRVELTDAGKARLGASGATLDGRGFELAGSGAELREREAAGERRLYLSAIGLRPAGRPDDALFIEIDHFDRAGITLHLAQADSTTVPWSDVADASLDLLTFKLHIAFGAEAVKRYEWLSSIDRFESDVRRA